MDALSKFPHYQPDQVLSAQHLNQSMAYLDTNIRLTRNRLIGIGIVCGLDVLVQPRAITVTKGVGVSSAGYLLQVDEDKLLTQVRDYTPPYPPKYEPFYTSGEKHFDMLEAVEQTEKEGNNLKQLNTKSLRDYGVVLYLEAQLKDAKECIGNDCDNKGQFMEYALRVLLIKRADLQKMYGLREKSLEDIANTVFARHNYQPLRVPRFNVPATALPNYSAIKRHYLLIIEQTLALLFERFEALQKSFNHAIEGINELKSVAENLKSMAKIVAEQPLGFQYFYEYLYHLTAAYNEFTETATRYAVECMPRLDSFPMHLALGELALVRSDLPPVLRNYFVHAPTSPEALQHKQQVGFLLKRLLRMTASFELRNDSDVRLTPSNLQSLLSNKAIPYYFRPNGPADFSWLKGWSFLLTDRGAWRQVNHYHNAPEVALDSDLEHNNFYRIEGYLGSSYTHALKSVKDQIATHRIPAKVVALSTGHVPFDLNLLEESTFADLDSRFESARQDLLCMLRNVQCFFGGLPQFRAAQQRAEAGAGTATHATVNVKANFSAADANTALNDQFTSRIEFVLGANRTFVKGQFIAAQCGNKPETMAAQYAELQKNDTTKGVNLLDMFKPYLNLSQTAPAQRLVYLLYVYPIFVIDEIEELAGIMYSATMADLDYKKLEAFANELQAFVQLYISEINRIDRESETKLPTNLADIKHQLIHLSGLCMLRSFFMLYSEYVVRAKAHLEQLRFSKFINKHPGIDHKGGVPRGGTFILVYHTPEQELKKERPTRNPRPGIGAVFNEDLKKDLTSADNTSAAFDRFNRANANIKTNVFENDISNRIDDIKAIHTRVDAKASKEQIISQTAKIAALQGLAIDKNQRDKLDDLLTDMLRDSRSEATTEIAVGTVFADFYLPYICCGSGGAEINIVQPVPTASIQLAKELFCNNDEARYPFTLDPPGGVVSGRGVDLKDGIYFFTPTNAQIASGPVEFLYTVNGITASLRVELTEAPEAAFSHKIESISPNGIQVTFINESKNATEYLWDFGNGESAKDENPKQQFYRPGTESAVVTLRVANRACHDTETQTIKLFERKYRLEIGKSTEFCGNDKTAHPINIVIEGMGNETFPFVGNIISKGVEAPDGRRLQQFTFNPAEAGVGKHKIEYVVDGKVAASLEVTVAEPFEAEFDIKGANWNDGALTVSLTGIQPKDKKSFNWTFDTQKPLEIEQRTNASDFQHNYPLASIRGRDSITIRLRVAESPCIAETERSISVPPIPGSNPAPGGSVTPGGTVNVGTVINVADANTRIGALAGNLTNISVLNTGRTGTAINLASVQNSPPQQAAKWIQSVAEALAKTATRNKIVDGSSNPDLAKSYGEVAEGLSEFINKNRRTMTVTQRNEATSLYVDLYSTLMETMGIQTKDLLLRDPMIATFNTSGNHALALKTAGMPAATLNNLKQALTRLEALNRPVTSAAAKAVLNRL